MWSPTQNGEGSLAAASEASGLPLGKCEVYKMDPGGGFGRRGGAQDYVRQAVSIAKQVPGVPIKLIWSREEDMTHDFYRPISQCRLAAGLDAGNNLVGLHIRVSGQSINAFVNPASVANGKDDRQLQGYTAVPGDQQLGYTVPNLLIEYAMRNTHVPVGPWRGVNTNQNAVYLECFMDEVARAAGRDPLEFRRAIMKERPKHLAVLDAVADKAGWGKPLPAGVHRGIAQFMGYGSYSAAVAEVSVSERGKVKVHRLVLGVDSGHVVNPAQVEAQVEGSVAYGLGAALYQEITIKDGRTVETNFDTYEMMRLAEFPKVETVIVPSGGFWGGIGEPTISRGLAGRHERHLRGHRPAGALAAAEEREAAEGVRGASEGRGARKGSSIMHVGVAMFCTDYAMAPTELARALEERGFESLWLPEHSHIPLSRLSPYPAGGELPKKYYDVMDPFVVLGAAAAVTTRLKIATGICLVPQRDPIQTAKAVATVDQISKGRFLFGVGAGWNADEMADHGTDFKSRNKVMRERIEAMRAIWTQTKPEYSGEFVKFGPMMTWPKPVQKPHPPVLVGGGLPYGARRALAYGDGWMPHARRPTYRLLDKLPEYREMEKAAGRTLPITAFGAEHDPAAWARLSRRRHRTHRAQHRVRKGRRHPAAARPVGRETRAGRVRATLAGQTAAQSCSEFLGWVSSLAKMTVRCAYSSTPKERSSMPIG